jgi:hypothetical protein
MKRRTRIVLAAAVTIAGLGAAGVAAVSASANDDTDTPITGTDLQRASDAALIFTGQGRVSGTEAGDEDSYYEVEVTLDDGTQVDVQLDKGFHVVDSKSDADDTEVNEDESD